MKITWIYFSGRSAVLEAWLQNSQGTSYHVVPLKNSQTTSNHVPLKNSQATSNHVPLKNSQATSNHVALDEKGLQQQTTNNKRSY